MDTIKRFNLYDIRTQSSRVNGQSIIGDTTSVSDGGTDLSPDSMREIMKVVEADTNVLFTINTQKPYWFVKDENGDDDGSRYLWDKVNGDGKLVKRIANVIWKVRKCRLSSDAKQQIGNIINQSSVKSGVEVALVRPDFNWTGGDYGDSGSCFMSTSSDYRSNLHALEAMPNTYALLVRYNGRGIARCWVHFDSDRSVVIFNAYNYNLTKMAQLLRLWLRENNLIDDAQMASMEEENLYEPSSDIYINNEEAIEMIPDPQGGYADPFMWFEPEDEDEDDDYDVDDDYW